MTSVQLKLPPKLIPIFAPPRGSVQYRAAKGGRGGAKSFNFAKMAATLGYMESLRILCTRDIQTSIKESFHAELKAAIASEPWLEDHYDVGVDYIRGRRNNTDFLFRGLRHGTKTIKSLAKIDLTIVEEAEDVTEDAWLALEATVLRQPKSELWALWNPGKDGSPVDNRFVKHPPSNALVATLNWRDNPFFPPGLDNLRRRDLERLDYNTYAHIWEGAYLTNSKAQVFANKFVIESFIPGRDWNGPYQGGDFGFSQDPLAANRSWVHDDTLYIEYDFEQIGLDLDDTGKAVCDAIPGFAKYTTRWDNSRPESISHLRKNVPGQAGRVALPLSAACEKWKGSVEDGIEFIKSFKKIVVHPRCTHILNELRLYSYKVDRLSGDILPDLVDAYNHNIDALRYALGPIIKRKGYSLHDLRRAVG